jgi:hypothetical protein
MKQLCVFSFNLRYLTASFANQKANTGGNGEYGDDGAEGAKGNTRECHDSHHDQINGEQKHPDISLFHQYYPFIVQSGSLRECQRPLTLLDMRFDGAAWDVVFACFAVSRSPLGLAFCVMFSLLLDLPVRLGMAAR